jgi:hypothetical protein
VSTHSFATSIAARNPAFERIGPELIFSQYPRELKVRPWQRNSGVFKARLMQQTERHQSKFTERLHRTARVVRAASTLPANQQKTIDQMRSCDASSRFTGDLPHLACTQFALAKLCDWRGARPLHCQWNFAPKLN